LLGAGIALVLQIALWVFEVGVIDTFQNIFDETSSYDGIVQAVEVEAIAENALSTIHNQIQTYAEMEAQAQQTQQTVLTTAGVHQQGNHCCQHLLLRVLAALQFLNTS
jgi:hypothetical protein